MIQEQLFIGEHNLPNRSGQIEKIKGKDKNKQVLRVALFSGGVSSAVAIKLMCPNVDYILYQHIDDQHPDTMRFVKECEDWFGIKVDIMQSKLKNVNTVARQVGYINGPKGAPCTRLLKRRLRKEWEQDKKKEYKLQYVWGMDSTETKRAERLQGFMKEFQHCFPLIEKNVSKDNAHAILQEAKIARPAMYDLGYPNNNCIGCVKAGMGYWNKIRKDFPDVFHARAKLERELNCTCMVGKFLDEITPDRGYRVKPVVPDCGPMCGK